MEAAIGIDRRLQLSDFGQADREIEPSPSIDAKSPRFGAPYGLHDLFMAGRQKPPDELVHIAQHERVISVIKRLMIWPLQLRGSEFTAKFGR
jgi:hypothetical protein